MSGFIDEGGSPFMPSQEQLKECCPDDVFLSQAELSGTNLILTRNDGEVFTIPLSSIADGTVTGASLAGTILTLTLSIGGPVNVDLAGLQDGNITGLSWSEGLSTLSATSSVGGPYSVVITKEIKDTVFVTGNGSDVNGLRQRFDRPFATPWAAVAAAVAGDTVVIYPGVYILGADVGTEKVVKDGVIVYLMAGVVLRFEGAGTSQPFYDSGVATIARIDGYGRIEWLRATDIQTSSHIDSDYVIRLSSFDGGRILCRDYRCFVLEVGRVQLSSQSFVSIAPTVTLSKTYCRVKVGELRGGVAGYNVIRYATGVGVNVNESVVEIDGSFLLDDLTTPAFLLVGFGDGTVVSMRARVSDQGGAQTGHILELGRCTTLSYLDIHIQFSSWSYAVFNSLVGCGGSGTVRLQGKIGDHAPISDVDVRYMSGSMNIALELSVDGSANTFGVLRGNGGSVGNSVVRRVHVGGRIRSSGTVPPFYFDAAVALVEQFCSLSFLTILTGAATNNNVNAGPGLLQIQVQEVRSNVGNAAGLLLFNGEVIQVIATTLV